VTTCSAPPSTKYQAGRRLLVSPHPMDAEAHPQRTLAPHHRRRFKRWMGEVTRTCRALDEEPEATDGLRGLSRPLDRITRPVLDPRAGPGHRARGVQSPRRGVVISRGEPVRRAEHGDVAIDATVAPQCVIAESSNLATQPPGGARVRGHPESDRRLIASRQKKTPGVSRTPGVLSVAVVGLDPTTSRL
jgi:hypothetical protein